MLVTIVTISERTVSSLALHVTYCIDHRGYPVGTG